MKRNPERMKYRPDKASYWLCIISIILNMVYFVSIYTNRSIVPDVTIGADVLINIIFMMIVFLTSEKLKAYAKKWNVYIVIVGFIQMSRIFWLPVHFNQLEMLVGAKYILAIVCLITSGILLLLAGINSLANGRILNTIADKGNAGGQL